MNHLPKGLRAALVAAAVLQGAACGGTDREETGTTQSAVTVCAGSTTLQGLDVSHYDGTIDWSMVQGSGRVFAFAKATDGVSYVDPTFAANWGAMKQAGLIRGAYHSFEAGMDPAAQAAFFVQTVGELAADDLPPVLDLEAADGEAGAAVAADALTFLGAVAALTGRTPIVYTSAAFVNGTLGNPAGLASDVPWVASWGVSCPNVPAPWTAWTFWQTSDTGSVPGASAGAVTDLDTFNGSLAQLQAFVAGSVVDGGTLGGEGGAGEAGSETGAEEAETGPEAGAIDVGADDASAILDDASVGDGEALGDVESDASLRADTGGSAGCGCRTAGTSAVGSSPAWLAFTAIAVFGGLRRRRRSAPLLVDQKGPLPRFFMS